MATTKQIVCLANSRKLNGRCVAGKEIVNKAPAGWIRPVSDREHEEVSEEERRYEDGRDPVVGDFIEMALLDPRPKRYQQENWLLDPDYYWKKIGHADWNELLDSPGPLWINGQHTSNGMNDQIPLALARGLTTSLRLVRVDDLAISVFRPGEAFGNLKRRVQAQFSHSGDPYHLWVTDAVYERRYLASPDGAHQIGEAILTASLGEPYNNACYKLVAAIIEPNVRNEAQ